MFKIQSKSKLKWKLLKLSNSKRMMTGVPEGGTVTPHGGVVA